MSERLGPAVREFALQVEALRDILPDPSERQRAALRVLSLRGTSTAALVLELEQALSALSLQNDAFTSKLHARRAVLEEQRVNANEACCAEKAQAEAAISRLQNELEVERTKLLEADAHRERALADCESHVEALLEKQLGFERAFTEIHAEYSALKQELTRTEAR